MNLTKEEKEELAKAEEMYKEDLIAYQEAEEVQKELIREYYLLKTIIKIILDKHRHNKIFFDKEEKDKFFRDVAIKMEQQDISVINQIYTEIEEILNREDLEEDNGLRLIYSDWIYQDAETKEKFIRENNIGKVEIAYEEYKSSGLSELGAAKIYYYGTQILNILNKITLDTQLIEIEKSEIQNYLLIENFKEERPLKEVMKEAGIKEIEPDEETLAVLAKHLNK
ncbi:MAG: hypothetical protein ACOCV1_08495 [Bacillota bacterium]